MCIEVRGAPSSVPNKQINLIEARMQNFPLQLAKANSFLDFPHPTLVQANPFVRISFRESFCFKIAALMYLNWVILKYDKLELI